MSHNNNNNNVESLRQFRDTHRRQREDAWYDEQSSHGLDFSTTGNNNNNNRPHHQNSNTIMNNINDKVVRIGVNYDHHAPFLPKVQQQQQIEQEQEEDANNSNNNTSHHRALVWPAKDPNGQFANLALKGSTMMREHRKKKIQKQTVRANVLQDGDDGVATEVGNKTEQQELEDHDEGADEDFIPTSSTSSTTGTSSSISKKNNNAPCDINDVIFDDEDPERVKIRKQRESLPAFKVKNEFIEMVRSHQVVIVQGQTGSGKSTQLASFLLEHRFASRNPGEPGIIGVTQPRRVAAIGLARRVSQELNTEVGDLVGYAVRLEDVTSDRTKLKFMTDGVLLREAVLDPLLWKYNVVVMDEAHERSIDTDVLLGVMKRVLKKRRDFKLVLMSATIQIEKFSDFFDGAPIFEVSGRTFPVHVNYAPNSIDDYVEAAVLQVMKVHVTSASIEQKLRQRQQQQRKMMMIEPEQQQQQQQQQSEIDEQEEKELVPAGDILVFMTGEEDVRCVCELIKEKIDTFESEMAAKAKLNEEISKQTGKPPPPQLKLKKLDVIPCFSTVLVNKEQLDRVLNPPSDPENVRRCIVATNVAETSLTIDGITVVIDCGFMKCKVFKPRLGAHPLLPFPVSQAQATQRTGRAGRTREGTCYRLYPQSSFEREMLESPVPEIKRSSIDRVCLFVKAIGINDVENFDFIDPPPTEIIHKSLYSLWLLGALDDAGKLTEKGHQLASLPVEPAMGTVLLSSKEYRCSRECISIAAMLSVDTRALFAVPRDKEEEALRARDQYVDMKSDHLTLYNLLTTFLRESEMNSGGEFAARKWAEKTFLSFSVLKTASGIRDQLNEQVRKLLFSKSDNNTKTNISAAQTHQKQQQQQPFTHRFSSPAEAARFCVVSGFFPQAAQRKKLGEYVTILTKVTAQLPPTSALAASTAEFVVFNELAMTTERSFLSVVTIAEPLWLEETSRGLFFIRGEVGRVLKDRQQQQQAQSFHFEGSNNNNDNSNNNNTMGNQQPVAAASSSSRAQQTLNLAASLLQQQQNTYNNVHHHEQNQSTSSFFDDGAPSSVVAPSSTAAEPPTSSSNNNSNNTQVAQHQKQNHHQSNDSFSNNNNNDDEQGRFGGGDNLNFDDDDAFSTIQTAKIPVKTKAKFVPRCKR